MKLLTLRDLYAYFVANNKDVHFSYNNDKDLIVVQEEGTIRFSEDKDTEGLLPVVLQSCHIDENVNGSFISEGNMTNALPSFSNRPILGYIHEVNGQPEFYAHNMHVDENGELVHDEIPVGIIPESCDAKLEYDKKKDKTYVVVNGYIFEEYSKAAEIMQREEECKVSVELTIRELSYDAVKKVLSIDDFYFSGVTILGKTEDGKEVKEGMVGSNIQIRDFSANKNGLVTGETKLIETLDKLNTTLSNFNINNSKEGGTKIVKFEELLKKYNKTEDDIHFDYEGLSDEELETKFKEEFDDTDVTEDTEDTGTADDEGTTVTDENSADGDSDETDETDGTEDSGNTGETENSEDTTDTDTEDESGSEEFSKKKKSYSVNEDGTATVSFELSHDDIRNALYNLLYAYEELDDEYYYITDVYDDYFVYEGWYKNSVYGQKYVKDGDNVGFDGERYELFKELLTASEKAELDSIRANYAEMSSKLASYEQEAENSKKKEILNSEEFNVIRDKEEFKSLSSEQNYANFSVEEVKAKADSILLEYYKSINEGKFSYREKKIAKHKLGNANEDSGKKNPYGSIFKKK